MSGLIGVVTLLKDKLSCDVFSGQIPESQTDPAVVVINVANPFSRTLSGKKVQTSSVWRVTVVAERQSDVESILDELEDMDNSTSVEFQKIFTNLVQTELGLTEQPYRRAFYDLTVYKR